MSHFTVAVLVPQENVPEPGHPDFEGRLMSAVDRMLAPFNEELKMRPYALPCSCAEEEASRQARPLAEQETGLLWEKVYEDWRYMSEERRAATTWEAHTGPLVSVWDRHAAKLLLDITPDKDCEECRGTGTRWSQRNKMAKWDWYSVGGRYEGRYPEYKIPTVIPNVAFARDVQTAGYAPFAILSPRASHQKQRHDNWNEQGEMGWFALVSNENDNWPSIAHELLGKYGGCFAVLMDCHI